MSVRGCYPAYCICFLPETPGSLLSLQTVQVIITYISFSAYFRGESVIPLSAVALAELFVLLLTIRRADHVFKVQQEEAR